MPTVSNVKLTLKKENAKSVHLGPGAVGWSGDFGGDWKATVTCDIKMSKNEAEMPYQVVITLYGFAENLPGGAPDSWVYVHRFFWGGSKGGHSGTTDHATVWKSKKKFSSYNYIVGKKLNVNKAVKASPVPGSKTPVYLARSEKIRAHVVVQTKGQEADSNEVKIKI